MFAHLFSALLVAALASAQSQATSPPVSIEPFTIPSADPDIAAREAQIETTRAVFLYGPSPLGNVSFYPTGALGSQRVFSDAAAFFDEAYVYRPLLQLDALKAGNAIRQAGGLNELDDYLVLYRNQWTNTNPNGLNPGYFTNYTQDLYFSMERLSLNPYALYRLDPHTNLPFVVEDEIVVNLTTQTLSELHQSGRLFFVDYSFLATIPVPEGKYTAACTAYFYLHPGTEEFLPLAIKTNVGADLVYTPLDCENDWFLAKTLFESNENFFLASYHLGSTHATVEIIHQAAVRSMANEHPVRGLLDRIMFRGYAIRLVGSVALFNPGGNFDQNFALGSQGLNIYSSMLYHTIGGRVQANYFDRIFVEHGLLNSSCGPPLPFFPFYQDVAPIWASIRSFMRTFVEEYYPSDDVIANDPEIQALVLEANGPAEVYDFPPSPLTQRETLIALLTHVAYLAGIEHHALNTNSLAASWTLPLHPTSHWAPLPTAKGIDSVMPYLPNVNQSISQIVVETQFTRPGYKYTNETLYSLFSDPGFLEATTAGVRNASSTFMSSMFRIGAGIESKRFDDQGLSQGMPFIWNNVNPLVMPFFLAI